MKMITISGDKSWSTLIDQFSRAVNDGKYHRLEYNTYRKLAKYNPIENIMNITRKNDGIITIVDPRTDGKSGYLLWSGSEIDRSFGSFLYDKYFKENEKMNTDLNHAYDMWGNYADAKIASNATNISSDSTNCSTSSWLSYPTPEEFQRVKNRVEELGRKCEVTDCETKIQLESLAARINNDLDCKADMEDLDHAVANINKLFGAVDEIDYDLNATVGAVEVMQADMRCFEDDLYEMKKCIEKLESDMGELKAIPAEITIQSTSSNVYPVRNYNIKADYMSGCDNRKEKENMDTNKMFAGFDFGPVSDNVKLSSYGMAIRNADGRYVSYDTKSGNIIDVEVFNFENHNLIFKMPVAVSAIAVGDTIIHMKKPMFVTGIENGITAIDIFNGEVKTIMPAVNMFNFNYITKVVSLFNFIGNNAPTADNPFGNILPFMLMSNKNMDTKDMFMMMAIANGNNMNIAFQNPMMMYAMLGNSIEMKEMLPFMMMSGMFNQVPVNNNHNCHCHNNGQN